VPPRVLQQVAQQPTEEAGIPGDTQRLTSRAGGVGHHGEARAEADLEDAIPAARSEQLDDPGVGGGVLAGHQRARHVTERAPGAAELEEEALQHREGRMPAGRFATSSPA